MLKPTNYDNLIVDDYSPIKLGGHYLEIIDVKESVSHWKFPKTKNGATFSFPISFYMMLPQPSMFDDSSSIKNK